jgi:hypothetical protein
MTSTILSLSRTHLTWIAPITFSLFYFLGASRYALGTLFWYDELVTIYLSRLPSITDLLTAQWQGIDWSSPIIHIVTRAANFLPGNERITNRLPEMIGVWVMCLCLYRFISQRCPIPYAIAAMLMPVLTQAFDYSYEARAYGLVLGCSGIALVCWQMAAEGQRRGIALVGLTLGLMLALVAHYYSIFIMLAFYVAEVVRATHNRRVDWKVLIALSLSGLSLLLLWPYLNNLRVLNNYIRQLEYGIGFTGLLKNLSGYLKPAFLSALLIFGISLIVSTFDLPDRFAHLPLFNRLTRNKIPIAVTLLLAPLIAIVLGTLTARLVFPTIIAMGLLILYHIPAEATAEPQKLHIPFHEIAWALSIMAAPFIVALITNSANLPYYPRYTISAIYGIIVLIIFSIARVGTKQPFVGLTLAICIAAFAGTHLWNSRNTPIRYTPVTVEFLIPYSLPDDLLVVISHPHRFLQTYYFADPTLKKRLIYLSNPAAALKMSRYNTDEYALLGLEAWTTVPVQDYNLFIRTTRRFLVHNSGGWVIRQLLADGARLELIQADNLYLAVTQMGSP